MKQKGINMATVDFEHDVTNLINTCALPASTIRLVLAKLLDDVVRIEQDLVSKERSEYENGAATESDADEGDIDGN